MPNGGLASLINPADRDDLFCFGMNKLSYIIQVKIVQVSVKMTTYKFRSVEDIIKCRTTDLIILSFIFLFNFLKFYPVNFPIYY